MPSKSKLHAKEVEDTPDLPSIGLKFVAAH
jgi:hypothetical protein